MTTTAHEPLAARWFRPPGSCPPPEADIDENLVELTTGAGTVVARGQIIDCGSWIWIDYLDVPSDLIGRGYGRAILTTILTAFPGRTFALSASADLAPWYRRHGFEADENHPDNRMFRPSATATPQNDAPLTVTARDACDRF